MQKQMIRRCLGLSMAMALTLSVLPAAAGAAGTDRQTAVYGEENSLTPILGTHVTIEGFRFPYTGQEIRPEVSVVVADVTLEEGTHYQLTYKDNLAAGEASVTVTGIPEGGYAGIVTIPFTIEAGDFTLTELQESHVTLEGDTFPHTGKPITPAVTVKVEDVTLTEGKDYSVSYENNTQPGTATVTVEGIATASMTQGYTGKVTLEFTITEKEPEETEESKPTEGEDPTEPTEETKPVAYKITKGDKGVWFQKSGKTLVFTADGKLADFQGVSVDGKKLEKNDFAVKEGTSVALKPDFLGKLKVGSHTVTIHFADGAAEGTFTVSDKLDPTNPITGDGSNPELWLALSLGSLAAVGGTILLRKKDRSV